MDAPDSARRLVHAHEWTRGDLVVWDNRCLVACRDMVRRGSRGQVMWRTTVSGNPGAAYAGEAKSWIAA